MNLKIVFEDAHLLVLYKPAGVPVQSARVGAKDCESMLKNYLFEKNPEKGAPYLGLIHRLDQPVEGLVVFAKTSRAAADLSRQLQNGRMKKSYLAVREAREPVVKNPSENGEKCGKVNKNVEKPVENWLEKVDFLQKDGKRNCSKIVEKGTAGAKRAVLRYRVLKALKGQELVEIQLLTGRHHQIRVQMAGLGTPLVGDRKYGRLEDVDSVDKSYPALCAYRLELAHPETGEALVFQVFPQNPAFVPYISNSSLES